MVSNESQVENNSAEIITSQIDGNPSVADSSSSSSASSHKFEFRMAELHLRSFISATISCNSFIERIQLDTLKHATRVEHN